MSNPQQVVPQQTNHEIVEEQKQELPQGENPNQQQNVSPAQNQNEMELQNQNQQIQADPVQSQQNQAQEEQQGEIAQSPHGQEERQQQVQNVQQNAQSVNDRESYINRLQIYLNKVKIQSENKNKQFDQLNQDNKKTKQTLKKVRFQFLSSKQQISTLNQQKNQLQIQRQSLKTQNNKLNEQLKVYEQAGDINFYKNKIIQLEKLLQIQKKQLQMKDTMIDQKDQLKQLISSNEKGKVEILDLISKYEKENIELFKRHAEVCMLNSSLENSNKAHEENIAELKLRIAEAAESLAAEKQKSLKLEEQIMKSSNEFQKKIKQFQDKISQIISNQTNQKLGTQNLGISSSKIIRSPEQQYGIKILTPIEQRNLIMREFIQLEINYQSVNNELSSLRERHYNTLREIKNISSTHISKKDFSELYKKYVKLRKCLESSLINEENMRKELLRYTARNEQNPQQQNQKAMSKGEQENQAFYKYKSLVLQEPENEINKVQKIIQKSTTSQKQLFSLKQQLQTKQKLIKSQKLLKQKEQRISHLEKQTEKCNNLIKLYDTELSYKNNEIQLLRKANKQNVQKIFQLQKNYVSKEQQHRLTSQIEQNKMVNQILEIKNVQSLKENAILKNQKQNLTELYTNLKIMYEDLLNKEPQISSSQNKAQQQNKNSAMQIEDRPCKQCLQREERNKNITYSQVESQTEGLSELYFKQIKELLTVLRKFPKNVDRITGVLEAQKSTIHEVKKRYDQVMQAYGAKYRQLDEEKKANDQWRLKQKDEIRQEFQQIRDFLMNQRLLTALRKAKSLIESYEQNAPEAEAEGEQNIQEGEQQEGDEKNAANAQEPIEQEKQNA